MKRQTKLVKLNQIGRVLADVEYELKKVKIQMKLMNDRWDEENGEEKRS